MDLNMIISELKIPEGHIGIIWMTQAGFIFKTSQGELLGVDLYLSDCVERLVGFKRLMPKIIDYHELKLDYLICSHEHPDHLDIDALPEFIKKGTRLIGTKSCHKKWEEMGSPPDKIIEINEGEQENFGSFIVEGVYADHGDLSPDAIGIVLRFENIKVYFTGDTAYRPEKMKRIISLKPEILILPINGKYNNLNAEEAAKLTALIRPEIVIPCHFWMFKEHNGDPQAFAEALKKFTPENKPLFITPGEVYIYPELKT